MRIGEYELSESTVFMLSESEMPITVGAGGKIPFHAAWEKGCLLYTSPSPRD